MSAAKTGAGVGVGAAAGFMFGGPIGAGIGALLGAVVAHQMSKPKGEMTPRRALVYTRAMESIKSPADLNKLADSFAGEGLHAQANMLRKRAALRDLPQDMKNQRRMIFRKAMCSDNIAAIRDVAAQFAEQGSTDAAKMILTHAIAVEAAHAAGASTRPVSMKMLEAFADKLAKAIGHFGSTSKQAYSSAANLIRAQGKKATKEAVEDLIDIAVGTLAQDITERQAAEGAEAAAQAPAPTETSEPEAESPAAEVEAPAPAPAAAAAPAPTVAAAVVEAVVEPATKVRVAQSENEDGQLSMEPMQAKAATVN
jgi:hypothetical protein